MQSATASQWLRRIRWVAGILILLIAIAWALHGFLKPAGIQNRNELGGEFTLTENTGKVVHYVDFRGKPLLMYFGYTYCPDVCPTALFDMGAALDELGPDAEKIQPLFISVDPERDTVDLMNEYVKTAGYPKNLIGLTGTVDEVAKAAAEWKVIYRKSAETRGQDDYLMDHSSIIYLMGPDGKFVSAFSHADSPDTIAQCLKTYLAGGKCRRS